MKRQAVLDIILHIHACVISAIMCQIKRYKDLKGSTLNHKPVIIRVYDVPGAVCTVIQREIAVTVMQRNIF